MKTVPQAEAPYFMNRVFPQEDWGCVSVHCLYSNLGVVTNQELYFQLSHSHGAQECQPPWPPEPGRSKGIPCVDYPCLLDLDIQLESIGIRACLLA